MELPARPAAAITDNATPSSPGITPNSTTIILGGPYNESEEPLSWWLITIIIGGGLLIILVTWRLIRRAS